MAVKPKRKVRLLLVLLVAVVLVASIFHKPLGRIIFVREYEDVISDLSQEYQIPESLLCAVIWTESHFRADAVSYAGASGLMQMMPSTFSEMRSRIGLNGEGNIFSPEDNLRCGAFYLRYLFNIYGNWDTVLAAYNGGLTNVSNWLKNPLYSDDGDTLKEIPIRETSDYVKKVLRTEKIYSYLYNYKKKED